MSNKDPQENIEHALRHGAIKLSFQKRDGSKISPSEEKEGFQVKTTFTSIDMVEVLKTKVLAGEAIFFNGPLEGPAFALHVALVNRLARETGAAVNVTYVA